MESNARFEVLAVVLEVGLSPERVNIPENFNVPKHTDLSGVETITVRLTFLAHSVRMRPNFQGLPWFECYGLGKMND
jgi:hypothetical protein